MKILTALLIILGLGIIEAIFCAITNVEIQGGTRITRMLYRLLLYAIAVAIWNIPLS